MEGPSRQKENDSVYSHQESTSPEKGVDIEGMSLEKLTALKVQYEHRVRMHTKEIDTLESREVLSAPAQHLLENYRRDTEEAQSKLLQIVSIVDRRNAQDADRARSAAAFGARRAVHQLH